MNQEKIGKFIATIRKDKNITQAELASSLGVSEKAVSNWENGRNLPDVSLFKPLCSLLDISINELLNGEKSLDKTSHELDETIIKLGELNSLKSMRAGIIGMSLFFIVLVLISTFKDITPAPLTSLFCLYNSVTYLSSYRSLKEKSSLVAGVLFAIAVVLNAFAFIMS